MKDSEYSYVPERLREPIKTVGMFPGQGSQEHGMGKDLAATFPEAREVFDTADRVLGYPLSEICFSDDDPRLHQTQFTQPAIVTHSIATLRVLEQRGLVPQLYVGHSLGELSAAVAAGALKFEDAVVLAAKRAELMKEAGAKIKAEGGEEGGMGYIVNADFDEVAEQVNRYKDRVFIANRNSPTQTIISGYKSVVAEIIANFNQLKDQGRRKLMAGELLVSEAAHSPLMEYARQRFAEFLSSHGINGISIRMPDIPLLLNGTIEIAKSAAEIRDNFSGQLVNGVDWVKTSQTLRGLGATEFMEIGPKSVLSGLMKKSRPEGVDEKIIAFGDIQTIHATIR